MNEMAKINQDWADNRVKPRAEIWWDSDVEAWAYAVFDSLNFPYIRVDRWLWGAGLVGDALSPVAPPYLVTELIERHPEVGTITILVNSKPRYRSWISKVPGRSWSWC